MNVRQKLGLGQCLGWEKSYAGLSDHEKNLLTQVRLHDTAASSIQLSRSYIISNQHPLQAPATPSAHTQQTPQKPLPVHAIPWRRSTSLRRYVRGHHRFREPWSLHRYRLISIQPDSKSCNCRPGVLDVLGAPSRKHLCSANQRNTRKLLCRLWTLWRYWFCGLQGGVFHRPLGVVTSCGS